MVLEDLASGLELDLRHTRRGRPVRVGSVGVRGPGSVHADRARDRRDLACAGIETDQRDVQGPTQPAHDDVTFQVPTTSPPHVEPAGQDGPPVPAVPVVPAVPLLELPPVPVGLIPVELQAPEIIANAIAIARAADWTFIEGLLTKGNVSVFGGAGP